MADSVFMIISANEYRIISAEASPGINAYHMRQLSKHPSQGTVISKHKEYSLWWGKQLPMHITIWVRSSCTGQSQWRRVVVREYYERQPSRARGANQLFLGSVPCARWVDLFPVFLFHSHNINIVSNYCFWWKQTLSVLSSANEQVGWQCDSLGSAGTQPQWIKKFSLFPAVLVEWGSNNE